METPFVTNWLRRDPIRWISGGLAGLFAAALAMALAMYFAQSSGFQSSFPIKLFGTILLGPHATDVDLSEGIVSGAILVGSVSAFLGMVFAHFVYTNAMGALLAMGLVWGLFSWVFIFNLFLQSFNTIFVAQISPSVAFPICVLFGLALSSVALFDRLIRR